MPDYRLDRIRTALYSAYKHKHTSLDLTPDDKKRESDAVAWHEIAASINNAVNIDATEQEVINFGERLRAFVIGNINRSTGETVRTKPKRIDDVVAYLLAEETFIRESELEEYEPGVQAAIRLREFLDPDNMENDAVEDGQIDGKFLSHRFWGDQLKVQILNFEYDSVAKYYDVKDHSWEYSCTELTADDIARLEEKLTGSLKYDLLAEEDEKYTGWAVKNYDGNFLVVLRDNEIGANRFYLTLFSGSDLEENNTLSKFLVLVEQTGRLEETSESLKRLIGQEPNRDSEILRNDIRAEISKDLENKRVWIFEKVENYEELINNLIFELRDKYSMPESARDRMKRSRQPMFLDEDQVKINATEKEAAITEDRYSVFDFPNWEAVAAISGRTDPWDSGNAVLGFARQGLISPLKKSIEAGFPINLQNPDNGYTLLHYAAVSRQREIIEFLSSFEEVDFLIKDRKMRYASDVAYMVGDDFQLAEEMSARETLAAKKINYPYKVLGEDPVPRV